MGLNLSSTEPVTSRSPQPAGDTVSISCEPRAVLVPLLLGTFFCVWEKTNPYLLEASVLFVCSWLGNATLRGSQWLSALLTEAVVVVCPFSH